MCHLSTLFKHLYIYTLFMLLIGATGDVFVMCFIRVFYQSLINNQFYSPVHSGTLDSAAVVGGSLGRLELGGCDYMAFYSDVLREQSPVVCRGTRKAWRSSHGSPAR